MPIQLPYIQPLSFQQANPFLSGAQAGLGLQNSYLQNTGQNNQNQVLAAQAQYAPYQQYADASLKLAQAKYMPMQYISQVLANPYAAMSMANNPGQLSAMTNYLTSMTPQGGNQSGVNLPVPGQPMQPSPMQQVQQSYRNFGNSSNQNSSSINNGSGQAPNAATSPAQAGAMAPLPMGVNQSASLASNISQLPQAQQSLTLNPSQQALLQGGGANAATTPPNVNGITPQLIAAGAARAATKGSLTDPYTGNFYDPTSSQWKSALTSGVTDDNQRIILGEQSMLPYIQQATKLYPLLQGLPNKLELAKENADNFIFPNNTNNYHLPAIQDQYNNYIHTIAAKAIQSNGINSSDVSNTEWNSLYQAGQGVKPEDMMKNMMDRAYMISQNINMRKQAMASGLSLVPSQGNPAYQGNTVLQDMQKANGVNATAPQQPTPTQQPPSQALQPQQPNSPRMPSPNDTLMLSNGRKAVYDGKQWRSAQ